jgi:hypothetical protein
VASTKGSGVLHWVHTLVPGGFDNPHCVHCMDETALQYYAYHTPATSSLSIQYPGQAAHESHPTSGYGMAHLEFGQDRLAQK